MRTKSIIYIFLILAIVSYLVGPLFLPFSSGGAHTAQAQGSASLVNIGVSAALCTFDSQISDAIDSLVSNIPSFGDLIDSTVGSVLPGGFVPVHVKEDDVFSSKDASDCIANGLKRAIIEIVRDDFLDFLENDGDPLVIGNFEQVLRDSVDEAERGVFADLGAAGICPHNRATLEVLLGGVISEDAIPTVYGSGFRASMNCTLTDVLDVENGGFEAFQEDYYAGGRAALFRAFEEDVAKQYFDAKAEFEARSTLAVRSQELETGTGDGFGPVRQCPPGEEFTFPDGSEGCRVPLQIISPASTIADQANRIISAEFDNLVDADEWDEVIKGIISILAREFIEDGLVSLLGSSSSTPEPPGGGGEPTPSPAPPPGGDEPAPVPPPPDEEPLPEEPPSDEPTALDPQTVTTTIGGGGPTVSITSDPTFQVGEDAVFTVSIEWEPDAVGGRIDVVWGDGFNAGRTYIFETDDTWTGTFNHTYQSTSDLYTTRWSFEATRTRDDGSLDARTFSLAKRISVTE